MFYKIKWTDISPDLSSDIPEKPIYKEIIGLLAEVDWVKYFEMENELFISLRLGRWFGFDEDMDKISKTYPNKEFIVDLCYSEDGNVKMSEKWRCGLHERAYPIPPRFTGKMMKYEKEDK